MADAITTVKGILDKVRTLASNNPAIEPDVKDRLANYLKKYPNRDNVAAANALWTAVTNLKSSAKSAGAQPNNPATGGGSPGTVQASAPPQTNHTAVNQSPPPPPAGQVFSMRGTGRGLVAEGAFGLMVADNQAAAMAANQSQTVASILAQCNALANAATGKDQDRLKAGIGAWKSRNPSPSLDNAKALLAWCQGIVGVNVVSPPSSGGNQAGSNTTPTGGATASFNSFASAGGNGSGDFVPAGGGGGLALPDRFRARWAGGLPKGTRLVAQSRDGMAKYPSPDGNIISFRAGEAVPMPAETVVYKDAPPKVADHSATYTINTGSGKITAHVNKGEPMPFGIVSDETTTTADEFNDKVATINSAFDGDSGSVGGVGASGGRSILPGNPQMGDAATSPNSVMDMLSNPWVLGAGGLLAVVWIRHKRKG